MVEYLENLLKNGPKYEINVCVIQDIKYYYDFLTFLLPVLILLITFTNNKCRDHSVYEKMENPCLIRFFKSEKSTKCIRVS